MSTIKTKGALNATLFVVTVALFTDMLIYGLAVPILPQYAASLGVSSGATGLLFASYSLALLLTTPLWGVLSDRIGRRTPMLLGLFGLFGATLLFAFAGSYPMLVVARVLQGIAAAATWTAGLALLADVFPSASRGRAMGLALAGNGIGILAGPFVGGLLYNLGGYRLPFLCAAGLALLDGLARLFLLHDTAPTTTPKPQLFAILRKPGMLVLGPVVALGAAIPALLEPVLPLFQHQQLDASPFIIGLFFMVLVISSAISTPLAAGLSDKLGRAPVIVAGLVATGLALPLVTLVRSPLLEGAALGLLGIVLGLVSAPTLPALADEVDHYGSGAYGAVYSVYNIMYAFGLMGGPIAGGFLTQAFGIQIALLCAGLFLLLAAPLVFINLHHRRTQPQSKTRAVEPISASLRHD